MKIPKPRKLAGGQWFIQLRLNGVSIPVSAATEKECTRQAALIKAEYQAGQKKVIKSELTLRECLERHIAAKEKSGRSPETVRSYNIILRNRFQSAMDKKVSSIRNWQELYNTDAEHLTGKTMHETWVLIRAAVKSQTGIVLPSVEELTVKRSERPFLEPEEIEQFVKAIKGHKHEIAMLLELSSCRSSEVSGLDWRDVDLARKRITIKGSIVRDKVNHFIERNENKTEESSRIVPIFIPELYTALSAVPDKSGKVVKVRPNTVYRAINAVCEKISLPLVGNHGLRHSFASLAYSLNIPVKATQQIGGWKDLNTVLKIYTHLAKRDLNKHTDALEAFFINANKNANEPQKAL